MIFLGVLANVDDTIKNLHLEMGLNIGSLNRSEIPGFLGSLEQASQSEIYRKLIMDIPCIHEDRLYYVHQAFDVEAAQEMNSCGLHQRNTVLGYIEPTLRLMRLFQEGNLCMPFYYYYLERDGKPEKFMKMWSNRTRARASAGFPRPGSQA